MVSLNARKLTRSSEELKVTTTYNNIIFQVAQGGYTEDLGVMKKKLSIEFESLTSAHLAYVDQLEQEGASAFEHTSHNDCQHWENYFVEIINKVTNAHYKIDWAKAKYETKEFLGSYQHGRALLSDKMDSV